MTVIYRPGKREDCGKLAELDCMAAGGSLEYLFHDLVPGMTPVQIVAAELESDRSVYSFRSVIVAQEDHVVVGMALSFPSKYHAITDVMRRFFPADRLAHFEDFFSSNVDNSLYLDALAVDASHRGRGIGEHLIALTKEKAVKNGFGCLSLIAFADNAQAISLYQRTGFVKVKPVELGENEMIRHQGGCWLMKCDLPK